MRYALIALFTVSLILCLAPGAHAASDCLTAYQGAKQDVADCKGLMGIMKATAVNRAMVSCRSAVMKSNVVLAQGCYAAIAASEKGAHDAAYAQDVVALLKASALYLLGVAHAAVGSGSFTDANAEYGKDALAIANEVTQAQRSSLSENAKELAAGIQKTYHISEAVPPADPASVATTAWVQGTLFNDCLAAAQDTTRFTERARYVCPQAARYVDAPGFSEMIHTVMQQAGSSSSPLAASIMSDYTKTVILLAAGLEEYVTRDPHAKADLQRGVQLAKQFNANPQVPPRNKLMVNVLAEKAKGALNSDRNHIPQMDNPNNLEAPPLWP